MKTNADRHAGKAIQKLRLENGKTQWVLCAELGMSISQLQKYEYGISSLNVHRLDKLCNIFDVEVSVFFRGISGS